MSYLSAVLEKNTPEGEAHTISTAQAARMLGLSTTMLQKLVDQEVFQSWKTPGGHRRIDLASVHAYQRELQQSKAPKAKLSSLPVVKVIVDDASSADEMIKELDLWSKIFHISYWNSMPEALLSFSTQMPDILVVQMSVPLTEQMATISAISNFIQRIGKPLSVVCLSNVANSNVQFNQSLPSSIQWMTQPFTRQWLHTFLTGAAAVSNLAVRNQ
jgi:excisionase family DNA binding protein